MGKLGKSFSVRSVSVKHNSHIGRGPAVTPAYAHEQRVIDRVTQKALNVRPKRMS